MNKWGLIVVFLFSGITGFAQKDSNKIQLTDSALYAVDNIMLNDTTMMLVMDDYSKREFNRRGERNRYYRLLNTVKKVYPLAKLAGIRMEEYAAAIDTLRRGQIKDLVAQIEDEIITKYGQDLRKLTFREGIILLKLLDRQTAHTPYAIIKELKSGFSAMIWQALAGLFDYDLKQGFNPNQVEEDMWIDEICVLIDKGKL